jgi:hypothetical protein
MKTNDFKLFLDDIRKPKDGFLYNDGRYLLDASNTSNSCWNIVRNYEDFCEWIDKFGVPSVVSLDHDLHFEHVRHYHDVTSQTGVIEYEKLKHKTGKHCAEYFVEKWKEAGHPKVSVYIHSANRWGQIEIAKVLKPVYDHDK